MHYSPSITLLTSPSFNPPPAFTSPSEEIVWAIVTSTRGLLSGDLGRPSHFLPPRQGNTITEITDTPAAVEAEPRAPEEILWILEEVRQYLSPDIKVRCGDVLLAWSGLRPLVRNPSASTTEGMVRNHVVYFSDSGLLTIAGGKWATYRAMVAE